MTAKNVVEHMCSLFPGLRVVDAWGEQSLFYNPDGILKRGVYFCTIKEKDGQNDSASFLNRDTIFRMSFGISKKSYTALFGTLPVRPVKSGVINTFTDFTRLNEIMPHPVYGWMAWVCILNPSQEKFKELEPLLRESYALVIKKYKNRKTA